MSSLSYRKDIDGLRAIAVLAVVVCHANPLWLPGGFVGVDIFFVISGFLITSIIQREIGDNTFSFTHFYVRRIKRILPVFYLVLFGVLVAGWLLLLPGDWLFLMKSAQYAAMFAANIYFTGAVDYFAPSMVETPLIHTWSLAVEEQFYLVWPALLILIHRFAQQYRMILLLLLCFLSFVLASVLAHDKGWSSWSFYLLPTRMGELLIGCMMALYKPSSDAVSVPIRLASVSGVILILLSLLLLDSHSVFPGFNALWPCLGAALLIYAGSHPSSPSPVNVLLTCPPMVFIGKISYSLYLWHWPILAFARYYRMADTLPLSWIAGCVLLAFFLAFFSWKYIEQPCRQQDLSFPRAATRYFLFPVLLLFLTAMVMQHYQDAFSSGQEVKNVESTHFTLGCNNKIFEDCRIGDISHDNQALTIMFGDSHARNYVYLLDGLGKKTAFTLDFFSVNACAFIFEDRDNLDPVCTHIAAHINEQLPHYDNIVIALRWRRYMHFIGDGNPEAGENFKRKLEDFAVFWTARGKKVYLMGQVPEYEYDVLRFQSMKLGNNQTDTAYRVANLVLQDLAQRIPGVTYIGFDDILLQWQNGMIGNIPGYNDKHHLSRFGQKYLLEAVLSSNNYAGLAGMFSASEPSGQAAVRAGTGQGNNQ